MGSLPLNVQHKILKLIKDNSDLDKKGGVRIISSTSSDLKQIVRKGEFLQELFYKLSVVSVEMPSLKDRREDIPELCNYFMKYFEKFSNLTSRQLSPKLIDVLTHYDWPGNVRQLKNVIEWLLINAVVQNASVIGPEMLPGRITSNGRSNDFFDIGADVMSMPLRQARELFERKYLAAQMLRFNNNISKTSSFVGMERSALHRKLKLLSVHGNLPDEIEEAE